MINRDTEKCENIVNGNFLNVGFGFMVNAKRITSIVPFSSKVVKTLYYAKRKEGKVFNATKGRKKQSIVIFDNGTLISSAFTPETIVRRVL